jgi:hypothetical protein
MASKMSPIKKHIKPADRESIIAFYNCGFSLDYLGLSLGMTWESRD